MAEAIAAFRQCVALQPEFPNARYNLGVVLGDAEQYEEAVACLQGVIKAEPERAETYNSLGYLAGRRRQPQQAIAYYEQAIALNPQYAQAHFNLGMTLLQLGNYRRGFAEYEWRWQTGQFTPFHCPHPQWDGRPIPDHTLLIHTEQGAGDAIQFARYLPLAAQRCKKLVNVANVSGGAVRNEGMLTLTNSTITGNTAAGGGGVLNEGAFTLTNSTLSGNVAYDRGGAVFNSGTVTLTQGTVSGNTASGDAGGGIHIELGSVTVIQSTITGNMADNRGGGLFNQSTLAITNSTLSGNSASYFGGGVYNYGSGTLTLTNTTISGNSVPFYGGGIFNLGALTIGTSTLSANTANCGGGLYTPAGTVSLTNSTISGNSITCSGGGIDNYGSGTVTLTNSTISGNGANGFGGGVENAGTLTLIRTLVSGNTAEMSGPEVDNYYGTVTADAFNLFGHDGNAGVYGFTTGPTDIVPSESLGNILDSTLAFNGGPTKTLNLVSGSPAVDAVTSGGCPATDQRGFVRDVGNCDVGAVEFGASAPPVINSRVTFVPLPDTSSTSTDAAATAAACGPGFVGTFFFQARMTNNSDSPPLAALKASVVTLSNNNLVQTADGGPGGVGAQQTLPQAGDFSGGSLAADGTVDVPFVVCLTNLNSFQFFVNVLGLEE